MYASLNWQSDKDYSHNEISLHPTMMQQWYLQNYKNMIIINFYLIDNLQFYIFNQFEIASIFEELFQHESLSLLVSDLIADRYIQP